jgi:hypothetical protein
MVDPDHRLNNYTTTIKSGTLTVTPVPLTVTAADATRAYGLTNAVFTGTITGLVNGDNITAAYSCLATIASPPGTYPIVPSLVDPDARLTNYAVSLNNGTLSVTPALLTVTAADATRVYGEANPFFAGTIVGLVNGENITATYSCSAAVTSPPGVYPIVPSLVDPNNLLTNYQVSLVDGMLSVVPAAPPTLVSVTPDLGPTNGGTLVTILGTGFENGATVSFGALPAAAVAVLNTTNLSAVTPPSGAGAVDVTVMNADGQSAVLKNGFTYVPPGAPPSIASQPTNQVVSVGATVVFSVVAAGTAPLNYQWQSNGTNLTDTGLIMGSQSNSLTLASVDADNAGSYQALVTNAYGSATSAVVTLTVVTPVVFQTVSQTGGVIAFAWTSMAGRSYQVEYNSDLNQTNWNVLGSPVTATDSMLTASDTLGAQSQRFYRVMLLP